MKHCPTCQEEFADKFGFCPVDGTPLGAPGERPSAPQASDESVVTEASTAAYTASAAEAAGGDATEATVAAGAGIPPSGDGREEFHLTFLEDVGLTRRLVKELRAVGHDAELTWPEFKRDPAGFTKRSARAYGTAGWKFVSQPNVALSILAAFVVIGFVIGFVVAVESL